MKLVNPRLCLNDKLLNRFEYHFIDLFLVFCALVLMNLQPTDCHNTQRIFQSIFDLYGENLQSLQPGDVLERDDYDLVLIFDHQHFFHMYSEERIYPEWRDIWCSFYPYPQDREDNKRIGKFKKIGEVPNPKVTFALAKFLAEKWLPYHPRLCTKRDWMNYICFGKVKKSAYWHCPLEASLQGVDEKKIEAGKFAFHNRFKLPFHHFPSLDDPKYVRVADRKAASCLRTISSSMKRSRQRRFEKRLKRVASSASRIADNLEKKVQTERSKEVTAGQH